MTLLANHLSADHAARELRNDVRDGLTGTPKSLPPKWFYDATGSDLFDRITRLPEYYPTRAEAAILGERATVIAAASGADTLVELGSGTSAKTRMLLDALRDRGTLAQVRAVRRGQDRARERGGRARRASIRDYGSTRSAVTSNATSVKSPVGEGGWWRFWDRPSAISLRGRGRRS